MKVDARGLLCPEPLIRVKDYIRSHPGQSFEIQLDSEVSFENVRRFLDYYKCEYTVTEGNGEYLIFVKQSSLEAVAEILAEKPAQPGLRVTAFVSSPAVGTGDDNLGRVLMHSFLKTLPRVQPKVTAAVFMNGGVKLAEPGSEFLGALEELSRQGIELHFCGTCLDFFGLVGTVSLGKVSNMLEICSLLADSERVLRP